MKRRFASEPSFTGNLQLFHPSDAPRIPIYQVMDNEGVILYPNEEPKVIIFNFLPSLFQAMSINNNRRTINIKQLQ